jgi:hypothetical protein
MGSILMGIMLQFAGASSMLKELFGELAGFSVIYILCGFIVLISTVLFIRWGRGVENTLPFEGRDESYPLS